MEPGPWVAEPGGLGGQGGLRRVTFSYAYSCCLNSIRVIDS